ncbi:GAF domain-containing SpoIIE family protein phosphatase [Streptomyces sp. NPDC048182]|uniref:GAF domain-containing SpoIIE family protein phosphatase n=1 Tax=Streptomyces sp. NPDC048182 TaxID=3365507 RepID=UPI003711E559
MPGSGERDTAGEPSRLEALRHTGLSAAADPGMDRFARLVSSVLGVPVALVSLLEETRQILPGMIGLGEPWASMRQTPLTHSLCRLVVTGREAVAVADTRQDARTAASPAVDDLGVKGYLGMPLTDADGQVLGALCAIDSRPRDWSARELADLEDLAAACSAELRLRIVSRQREQARRGEAEARHQAEGMRERTQRMLERSQLLLRAADALADTTGLAEVQQRLRDLVSTDLEPAHVGLALVEEGRLRHLPDPAGPELAEHRHETYPLDSARPSARAVRESRTITVHGPDELAAGYGPEAVAAFDGLGLHTLVCVPLPGTVMPLGTLVLGWERPNELDIMEQAVLAALAGYTARAVERAVFVEDRIDVAHQLQQAMLTSLPRIAGLEAAALYRPAAAADMVGGDWYDLYPLPAVTGEGEPPPRSATLALTIGDITGHDMKAATLMGQTRSMLRQADLDHPGATPAEVVTALEHANHALGIGSSGTLVHAHLGPRTSAGEAGWELTFTNAGHPPPLLAEPGGPVLRLEEHGPLLHPALGSVPRAAHRRLLPPGAVLLFYTDGLVEHRGTDLDAFIDRTRDHLDAHRDDDLPTLLTGLADTVAGPAPGDDVALLAVRVSKPAPVGG